MTTAGEGVIPPFRAAARVGFLIVVGLWVGAMLYFSAVTAPAAFAALGDVPGIAGRQLAGSVVRIALGRLNVIGSIAGPVAGVLLIFARSPKDRRNWIAIASVVLVASLGLASLLSHALISARLEALRAEMGAIDTVAVTDTRRVEFDRLHRASVGIMSGQLIIGFVIFGGCGWEWLKRSVA